VEAIHQCGYSNGIDDSLSPLVWTKVVSIDPFAEGSIVMTIRLLLAEMRNIGGCLYG